MARRVVPAITSVPPCPRIAFVALLVGCTTYSTTAPLLPQQPSLLRLSPSLQPPSTFVEPLPSLSEAKSCNPLVLPTLSILPSPLPLNEITIEDEQGELAPFYQLVASLLRGERKDSLRILVYGDSNITADWITGGLRRTLQEKWGDAGHGFVALGSPWPGYVHIDVNHRAAQPGWAIYAVSTKPLSDHRYGFAGIAIQSTSPHARTWIETAGSLSPVGQHVSQIGIHYLKGPKLGSFRILIDGRIVQTIDTEAARFSAGYTQVETNDGPHRITFESISLRPIRLFGATMERTSAGIVVDSAGIAASVTATMLRQDPEILRQTLQQRAPDLIILAHGTFDVAPWNTEEQHRSSIRSWIARLREALPKVAILILSPVDHRGPLNDSRGSPQFAAKEKRKIAEENHVAFWDLRAAMGGDHAIQKFRIHHMADPDQIHLNKKGGLLMGNRLALALSQSLEKYLRSHPTNTCSSPTPDPGPNTLGNP